MLRPSQVQFYAKKAENKNYRFRSWLKMHADPDDLDAQFLRLHKELFSGYDCSRCRNCCKHYCGTIPAEDVERDAEHLHMSADAFVEKYIFARFVSVNCWSPTVSVFPLMVMVSDETGIEAFAPSVVSKVR